MFNQIIRKIGKFLPDHIYIEIQYFYHFKKFVRFDNPKSFNEKLQWLKLYDRNPDYVKLVDKFEVRKHISTTGGDNYLIPLIGAYDSVEDIRWETLPNKFVLKCTHGSGSNIICNDKGTLNRQKTIKQLIKWMRRNWFWYGREWPYRNVEPRIICEQFLSDGENVPCDYKVLCFEGSARLIEYHKDRFGEHTQDFYDRTWALTSISQKGIPSSFSPVEKPKLLSLMLDLSEQLAHNIPHVRVDWYIFKDRLYFGEMTFFDSSGFQKFEPEFYDYLLGSWLDLSKVRKY